MDKLYLGPWFGPGPVPPTWSLEVLYAGGRDRFEVTHYKVDDSGYLILLLAEETVDGGGVALNPVAVFAPGGWQGLVKERGRAVPVPLGFQPETVSGR
jgi:hypothetical protein